MDAWIGVVGVIAGVALGLFGTALTERWRHSYIRNDARTDRQAATLREALDDYATFVLAWSPVMSEIAHGGTVDMLDATIIGGPPGTSHQRLSAVIERIHIETIRHRLGQLVDTVMTAIANGTVTAAFINDAGQVGVQVAAEIGTELRKLEAQ
jgi:hypothetical protein